MALAPSAASTGTVKVDGTVVGGAFDAKVVDKTTSEDITAYGDTAVARFPVIDDADFSFDFIFDAADAGQIKLYAAKSAHTPYAYKRYLNATSYYQMTGYVAELSQSGAVKGVPKFSCKIDVTGGAAYHAS